jgi:CHAT domain-containing protein
LSAQQETDLVSAFPSARVIRLVGSGATLTRFIELPLRSAAVLSIVAHGIYDAGRDWSAGLLLSPTSSSDGVLSIEDIEGLDSVPPIVALWACSSARGHVRLGDDATAQLAFAFLARGASAVIVIRAAVSQREAVELAGEFHRCLATAADSPAEALRVARRRVEERHPSRDPFECGITAVIGLGLRTSLHPARTGPREGTSPARFAVRIPWILAGLGCALAAGAWARRRRRS